MILISDPAVAAVPVVECGEPLRAVAGVAGLMLDVRKADPRGRYGLLRAGVLDRLCRAQARLPAGLHLLVIEGYRPPALQEAYFADYAGELRRAHPDWPAERVEIQASRYISPPRVAPHPAGAAVDLTLCAQNGDELGMGTAVNASPEESAGACYFAAPQITGTARANRDLLAAVLSGAGLVNYPTEWWHWSYGDRYWAYTTGAAQARYGPIDSRTVEP
ncbi:MAG: M15 family metallopeptidase [Actinomycetota bacterium]|nr:M15 family metallopeptidase [Actinomycetota bacterium]